MKDGADRHILHISKFECAELKIVSGFMRQRV